MVLFDPEVHSVERVLVFSAHPDDVDFGAAGTVAAWTAAGVQVSYCIMTDGDAGGFDETERGLIPEIRLEEQRQAAAAVGVTDLHFLGHQDGYLQVNDELIRQIVRLIRRIRPDIVVSMSPDRNWERLQKSHPDHLACGEAVTRAIYPAVENPFAFPELAASGLEAYKVPWLWFYAGPTERENHFVDVSKHVDAKLLALRSHFSQHPDPEAMDAFVRAALIERGREAGFDDGRSVEAFHVVGVNNPGTIAGF
jgi:LmbE family N-acetylglucosaminyl deacetylase